MHECFVSCLQGSGQWKSTVGRWEEYAGGEKGDLDFFYFFFYHLFGQDLDRLPLESVKTSKQHDSTGGSTQ